MLEALISILIFSFGILGLVGLQAQSIRHINDAQYRGEAVYLANSYVAQMWADDPLVLGTKYGKGGNGYNALRAMTRSLPGAELDANAPEVTLAAGPSVSRTGVPSTLVTVSIFWQLPGEQDRHNYSTTAVVGGN